MKCAVHPGAGAAHLKTPTLSRAMRGDPRGLPRKGAAPPGGPLPNWKGWENNELTAVLLGGVWFAI